MATIPFAQDTLDRRTLPAGDDMGLAMHVRQCRQAQGRWFGPALWVERAHGWVGPRFVTTIALASIALVSLSDWR